ncbi:restriction endonuclease [Roseiflexus sp.]|uniref:restriction endonuclease n=1 Tax=Roseiflexus sp. TaxID=2562120 RepID=UPI00398AD721
MAKRSRSGDDGYGVIVQTLALAGIVIWLMFNEFTFLWKLTLITVIITLIVFIVAVVRRSRINALRRKELLALSPSEFEQRVAMLLTDLGWRDVHVRGGSGDRGVDVTAERDGQRYLVQCKRYTKSVGPNYVRDLIGALHIQRADRAILVTTSSFSQQCFLEARDHPVELWDHRDLLERIEEAERLSKPHHARRAQQLRYLAGVAVAVNVLLVGLALIIDGLPLRSFASNSTVVGQNVQRADRSPASRSPDRQTPTATPRPTATPHPTETPPAPTPIPLATAVVFNGGNVRAAPNLRGTVLDQIHAYETVVLLGRSPDGLWLRIINPRQQEGWVHRSLLTIDPAVEADLPVLTP